MHTLLDRHHFQATFKRARPLRRTSAVAVSVVAFNLVVLYLRAPDAFAHPQFWAEDGSVFFNDSHILGLKSLLTPFAGYLHAEPRVVALICDAFSAVEAPTLYFVATLLVVTWTSVTLALCSSRFASLYAILIFSPPGCSELFGTLTNVQWFMQTALLLLVITPAPENRSTRVNQILFASVASLTGPFSIFILPVALIRLAAHRDDSHAARIGSIVFAGAVVQLCFVIPDPGDPGAVNHRSVHLATIIMSRWYYQLANDSLHYSLVGKVETAIVVLAGLSVVNLRDPKHVYMYAYCLVVLTATWVHYLGNSEYLNFPQFAERYFYAPRLIVIWCIADALCSLRRTSIVALAGAAIIVSNYAHWQRIPLNDLPWRSVAWRIDHGEAVSIVINPSSPGDVDPYAVTLPAVP